MKKIVKSDLDPLLDLICELPEKYRSKGIDIAKLAVDIYVKRLDCDRVQDGKDV